MGAVMVPGFTRSHAHLRSWESRVLEFTVKAAEAATKPGAIVSAMATLLWQSALTFAAEPANQWILTPTFALW